MFLPRNYRKRRHLACSAFVLCGHSFFTTFAWVTPDLQQPRQPVRLCLHPEEDPGTLERYRKRQLRRRQQRRRVLPPERVVPKNNNAQHIFVSPNMKGNNKNVFSVSNNEPTFVRDQEEIETKSDEIIIISQYNETYEAKPSSSNLSSPRQEEEEKFPLQHQHNNDSVILDATSNPVNVSEQYDAGTTKRPSSSLFGTRTPTSRWKRVLQTTRAMARVPHALKQTALWERSMKRIIRRHAVQEDSIIQDVDYHYVRRDPIDVSIEAKNRTFENARYPQRRPEPSIVRQLASHENSMTNASVPTIPQYRPKRPRPTSELKSASTRSEKRRIYNPYNNNNKAEEMDSVDRIGQFLANTVDQFFWGQYDNDDDTVNGDEPATRQPPPPPRKRPSKQTYSQKTRSSSRHWKDRLEERFDSIMGIHEDGEVYNRWFQYEQQEENVPRKRPARKKPFWEEEGSLIALLLGRSKNGERLSWEKALTPRGGDGSLVTIFRTVLQTTLVFASYAFRWASVRGAIPQPVVVLGVSAAGLCVRHHRIRAMVLALILFRTVGELVHGGLYGQDGWEDDTDESP